MAIGKLTSKGQVTIPREIRDRMGLKKGDRVIFRFDEQGRLELLLATPTEPLGSLPGVLSHLAAEKPRTLDDMRLAVRRRAAAKSFSEHK